MKIPVYIRDDSDTIRIRFGDAHSLDDLDAFLCALKLWGYSIDGERPGTPYAEFFVDTSRGNAGFEILVGHE